MCAGPQVEEKNRKEMLKIYGLYYAYWKYYIRKTGNNH